MPVETDGRQLLAKRTFHRTICEEYELRSGRGDGTATPLMRSRVLGSPPFARLRRAMPAWRSAASPPGGGPSPVAPPGPAAVLRLQIRDEVLQDLQELVEVLDVGAEDADRGPEPEAFVQVGGGDEDPAVGVERRDEPAVEFIHFLLGPPVRPVAEADGREFGLRPTSTSFQSPTPSQSSRRSRSRYAFELEGTWRRWALPAADLSAHSLKQRFNKGDHRLAVDGFGFRPYSLIPKGHGVGGEFGEPVEGRRIHT